jgi:hypothetical protein
MQRVAALIGVLAAALGGCGGGGGGGTPAIATASSRALATVIPVSGDTANVLPITIGRANKVNLPMASVTICIPGTSECQTIDNVLVDTGSVGLRIAASALSLSLPAESGVGGAAIAECAQFADGYAWGAVKIADVKMAGEAAAGLPVQVIDDGALPAPPAACTRTGRAKDTVRDLGANGILGLGAFRHDCGTGCEQGNGLGIYYACASSTCVGSPRPVAQQVTNPVTRFAANNNGLIVQLPAVPATGSPAVDGSLVFGIGTQTNNALGTASVFTISTLTGGIVTFYKGQLLDHSFLDTGSNALFFPDSSLPACGATLGHGFYCAPTAQSLSATIQGSNGTNTSVSFNVENADALLATGSSAFNNIAAPVWSSLTFDWGLPFFFGRRVFVAIEGASVPGASSGPFVAF